MPVSQGYPIAPYTYTQEEYLDLLRDSKFGLCLSGYGPKCNREIELMALGSVPIFTPGVDNTYFEPLIEGVHYLFASTPEKIPELINNIDQYKWETMSLECRNWFERNCSVVGSFNTTKKIINSITT